MITKESFQLAVLLGLLHCCIINLRHRCLVVWHIFILQNSSNNSNNSNSNNS